MCICGKASLLFGTCQQGVAPDPAKIDAVRNIPPPSDLKQLRSFLGLTGYYRRVGVDLRK